MLGGEPELDTVARTYARVLLSLSGADADRFVARFTETVALDVHLARLDALRCPSLRGASDARGERGGVP